MGAQERLNQWRRTQTVQRRIGVAEEIQWLCQELDRVTDMIEGFNPYAPVTLEEKILNVLRSDLTPQISEWGQAQIVGWDLAVAGILELFERERQ